MIAKKTSLLMILSLLFVFNHTFGQTQPFELTIDSVLGPVNGTVDVSIRLGPNSSPFSQLFGTIAWDSSIISFNSVTYSAFFSPLLPPFSLVPGSSDTLQILYTSNMFTILNPGDPLFTLRFDVIGSPGQVSPINMANSPIPWIWSGNSSIPDTSGAVSIICVPPTPAFAATGNLLAWSFSDSSKTYAGANWHWDFGDGTNSSLQNPTHTYANPGNYTVCLTVTDSCSSDSTCQIFTVCPIPGSSFSSSVNQLTCTFSSQFNNSPTSVLWDFGDGNSSTIQNPNHTYATNGTYTVCLIATNACASDTFCQQVTICPFPQSIFSKTSSGFTTTFSDQSTGTITSWAWDFGDGSTSTQQNPVHTYGQTGTFFVCLNVSNACGSSLSCSSVSIVCPVPVSGFISSSNVLTAQFTDQSNNAATFWSWDFGDGNTSNQQNPSHTYSSSGSYTVCLIAGNNCGIDSICIPITITCQPPVASFTFISTYLTVQFSEASLNAPTIWQWDFGDGNTSALQNPSHTYANQGNYTVCLIASSSCGNDTSCLTVSLVCPPPASSFSYVPNNLSIQFSDASLNLPNSWKWDFGDGNTSLSQHPNHTYSMGGTYTVCLIAENTCGLDTFCQTLSVSCLAPIALFSYSANNLFVQFSDASLNSPNTWAWDFGDGNNSIFQGPGHTYALDGTYTVCLTVGNVCGDSISCESISVIEIGLKEKAGGEISLYPNPTSQKIVIESPGMKITEYRILSMKGKVLNRGNVNRKEKLEIILDGLSSGIYILELNTLNGQIKRKLILD